MEGVWDNRNCGYRGIMVTFRYHLVGPAVFPQGCPFQLHHSSEAGNLVKETELPEGNITRPGSTEAGFSELSLLLHKLLLTWKLVCLEGSCQDVLLLPESTFPKVGIFALNFKVM